MKLVINLLKYQTVIVAILMLLLAPSCKKFLDKPQPTQSVAEGEVFKTVSGVRSFFNGIYSKMRQPWAPIGATVINETENWGYAGVMLTRVNNGIDIINPGGWYQYDYRMENREPTYRRAIFTWQFFYETINQANVVIKGVNESTTLSDEEKEKLIAEARALRAWFYFEVVREFQLTVAKDPAAPGVPVYTDPTTIDNRGKPRGTVGEVYSLIDDDLEYAINHIGTERVYKSQITLPVAYGMLARVMLEQHRWEEAVDAAREARTGFSLDAEKYSGAYRDMEGTPEVIWGFPQSVTGSSQSQYYNTPSSFYEKTGQGYDNFYMNAELVESFSPTDIRNLFFITNASPDNQRRYSTNKFGKPMIAGGDSDGDGIDDNDIPLVNGGFERLKEIDFEEDIPMMRTAEMYLIEAEALAEMGEEGDAQNILLELQQNRDPEVLGSGNAGQALIDEILLERRKELYGECGIDYMDIKRRQIPYERAGNHSPAYQFVFPANAKEFVLKIPQREIDTNEFIDDSDQNE